MKTGTTLLLVGGGAVAVGLTAWALWPKKAAAAGTKVVCPPGTFDSSGSGAGPCVPTSNGGGGATNQQSNSYPLGPKDDGSTLNVSPGDRIIVGLPEDPGTGASWAAAVLTDGVLQLSQETTTTDSSGTTHVFTLQVMQLGTTKLQANLVDPSGVPIKSWQVTVNNQPRQAAPAPGSTGSTTLGSLGTVHGIGQISPGWNAAQPPHH